MNQKDIVDILGFPHRILVGEAKPIGMVSKIWKCDTCSTLYISEFDQPIPAPCKNCGNIFFRKLNKIED